MSNANGFEWLLAPMEVSALVAGTDAGTYAWSDLAPDFSKIWNVPVLVGPDLVSLFQQGAQKSAIPGPGIHLHWFLPEACGRSAGGTFPAIPNRWLVQRVRFSPDTTSIKDVARWIVESDYLYKTSKPVDGAITVLRPTQSQLFDSMGRAVPLDGWAESTADIALTALGSGVPYFAAHYPACKSVLGFHDPKPSNGDPGDWQVSYQVAGWYSDPGKDLLNGVDPAGIAAKLDTLDWVASAAQAPGRVLCHGAVCRIRWNAAKKHIPAVPQPPKMTVCLGNSTAETLSTVLATKMGKDAADIQKLEPLLAGFQFGMLDSLQQMDDVDAEFHRHRFITTPGADHYWIEARRKPAAPANADPLPMQAPSVERLPPELDAALADLNAKAREDARQERELASLRQTLFGLWALWARDYITAPFGPKDTIPADVLQNAKDAVTTASNQAKGAVDAHQTVRQTLEDSLNSRFADLELEQSTEPPFFRASDPAILFAGTGLAPRGVIDRYIRADKLACRWASEIITGVTGTPPLAQTPITVHAKDLYGAGTFLTKVPVMGAGPSADLLNALLSEILILDPADPAKTPLMPPVADLLTTALEGNVKLGPDDLAKLKQSIVELLTNPDTTQKDPTLASETSGVALKCPDPVALFCWMGNPWRPVLLAWEVVWHPDPGLDGDASLADAASPWQPWPLDASGNEFQLSLNPSSVPSANPASDPTPITLRSYTMLDPHPEWVLRRQLEKLKKQLPDGGGDALDQAISNVDSLDVLAQSLSGFHDALRQLRQGLQLPSIQPGYVTQNTPPPVPAQGAVADPVWGLLDTRSMLAPDTSNPLQPIRAGRIELGRMWLIDSFGQTAKPLEKDYEQLTSFGLPTSPPDSSKRIALPPRYVQPARLNLDWLPANDSEPGGSPLCGWIFPNHLDQSLMVCDAQGKLLGALQTIIRVKLSNSRNLQSFFWVPVPGSETTPADIPDRRLRDFVQKLTMMGADAGASLLASIAAAQGDSGAAAEQDPRISLLVGKPLALARASLNIELASPPAQRVDAPVQSAPIQNASGNEATRGFTRVAFPVRLGGAAGAAGGLAGYLLDAGDDTFYARYGIDGAEYPGALEHNNPLWLEAESAVEVTLLMDPAAPVYARCGLLPRHAFYLPAAAAASVSSIRDVFFQSAPLVGPAGTMSVPRPSDDYGQWSWAVRPRVTYWQESTEIADPGDRAAFAKNPVELQEGWLKLAMNPVNISALWVKEGSLTVEPGTRVTLGWSVEGADALTLADKKTNQPLASWSRQPDSNLPAEFRLQVTTTIEVSLTATDQQGNTSVKSLQLTAKKGASQ
ncbi:MAG TPA: hypothetical protein VGL22_15210 [Terracidiphilus sp.]|jgi:hypothetical protein